MKKLLSSSIVLSLALLGCNGSSHAGIIDFTIILTGSQESPANAGGAAGGGVAFFDTSTDQISLSTFFTGLSASATTSHIHDGGPGVSGPALVSLTAFTPATTSGSIVGGPLAFPVADIPDLLAGETYFDIHNATFPLGEIRGQLVPVTQPAPTITPTILHTPLVGIINFVIGATGLQETPANTGGAASGGIASFNTFTDQISLSTFFTGLSAPATVSHIHDGGAGASGPPLVSLTAFTPATTSGSIVGGSLAFPVADIPDLLAGNTYFDIHNATFPGGEIRGQLQPVVQFASVPEPSSILLLLGAGLIGLLLPRSGRCLRTT
jgi:hypothetical protein